MFKIASNGGIGNRLRTMIGYASVYKKLNKPLPVFVWKDTRHAPPNLGAFGITGTRIIDARELDDETIMIPGTIDIPLMHRTHDLPSPDQESILEAYGMIEFSEEVQADCPIEFDAAVHLRMTDIRSENRFQAFREYLLEHYCDTLIYLACDEEDTLSRLNTKLNIVNHSHFQDINGSLRKTTIRDAAADMLTCIKAKQFIGTKASSFSSMIRYIRWHNGKEKENFLI